MASNQEKYSLGLDIGIASVGAALLADDHIIALHVRTFEKAETAKEGESLNKIRRDARLTRRRLRRRAHRLLRLRRMLRRIGLSDSSDTSCFDGVTISPWQLRCEGLDRLLEKQEWAAVMYHIVKHRGFQSTRKSEAKADAKVGEMLGGVGKNHDLLQQYRSVGEMAWKDERFLESKRNKGGDYSHTFLRADLAEELSLLFRQQRLFGNSFADAQTETFVRDLLMARKPALSGDALLKMVGRCTFEPKEYRAPKASYTAERFVWLTKLLNLRISGIGTNQPLSPEQRDILINMPFAQSKITYKQVRSKLGLTDAEKFAGLDYRKDKDPEAATLFEAKAYHEIRKAYESAGHIELWLRDSRDSQRLDDVAYALTVFKEDVESRKWLSEKAFEPAIIEAVLELSFEKFVRLSLKALKNIVPHMEKGMRYDEAVLEAGYAHHSQIHIAEKTLKIPPISNEHITNPVVRRALNQARKLVNAIVSEYGPPTEVHIELARDLNKDFKERQKIKKLQNENRDTKEKDILEFERLFRCTPKGLDLLKWRLYREQNAQCAYCQKGFDLEGLYDAGYAEVDHALPYSRSFDDGLNNKVLVCTKHNRDKGNRTPFEYLGGSDDTEQWRNFVAWVMGNPKYRLAKRQRLLRKDFGNDEAEKFRERNLTDTRYACKEFKKMVETHLQLSEESDSKKCVVVSGQLTSYLRARWGLIKVREDGDLHHALDAAVVAACSHGMVKRLSGYSRRNELELVRGDFVDPETGEIFDPEGLERAEKAFPLPWDGFRKELIARLSPEPTALLPELEGVKPVRVSRAPTRRGMGAAHQETIRSARNLAEGVSTVKTPLTSLSLKDLPKIVGYGDPRNKALIEAIEQRLREHGDKADKAFKEPLRRPAPPGREHLAPIVRSVRLYDTQKSGIILPSRGGGIANNGDMVRVDIFKKDGKYHAVPLYVADAAKNELPNKAVMASKPESEWTVIDDTFAFLFSLYPNDWVKVTLRNAQPIEGYYAGLDRATGAISVWAHDRSQKVGKDGLIRGVGIKTALSLEKYNVDLLGRIYRVKNETRTPLKRR